MLCLIANRAKYQGFRWWLSHSMRVISNDELSPIVRGEWRGFIFLLSKDCDLIEGPWTDRRVSEMVMVWGYYCCLTWWIFNCFFLSFQKVPGASGGALPKRRNAKLFLGIVNSCFHTVLFWPCLHVYLGSVHHCVWFWGSLWVFFFCWVIFLTFGSSF